MERGLLWLPLLALFIGLAWAGWAEYQKIETYQRWAEGFEQAKYDLYSVLGYRDGQLTFGKATRQGIINAKTLALASVETIQLQIDGQSVDDFSQLPDRGNAVLLLQHKEAEAGTLIPFTQIGMAVQWATYLRSKLA